MTSTSHPELDEVYRQIIARAPEHDINPSLDRVQRVCELLGDPQNAYQVVHITGTNGKTSTSRMIDRLISVTQLRTGRFTSPHLSSVTERIVIDNEPISPEKFVETYYDVLPYVKMVDDACKAEGRPKLSFFEVLTVMAFAAFAEAPIDVAVIEVGLGGQWDSTNIVDSKISVFTPIALDHTKWLGDTVQDIAHEKSGIIKVNQSVVCATQTPNVAEIIAEKAKDQDSLLFMQGRDFEVLDRKVALGGQLLTIRCGNSVYADIFLPLHGSHQSQNAAVALFVAQELLNSGGGLDSGLVQEAFETVESPGRLEVVRNSPTFLVDAAHNPAGVKVLVDALEEAFAFERLVGVVGVLDDKDASGMLELMEPILSHIVITQSSSQRSITPEDLAEIANDIFDPDQVQIAEKLPEALSLAADLAESADPNGVGAGFGVIVFGSVVLAAEARILLGKP